MKRRYEALDGLRGVAAVLVVAHHIQGNIGVHGGPFGRGFLAVDFFFALSGFVIASAYEPRFQTGLMLRQFAATRMIRIYPLIFLGALMGAGVAWALHPDHPFGLALVSQVLLVPGLAGGAAIFLLNSAHWSIVFELLANAAHALGLKWLTTRRLAAWVALSGLAVISAAWKFDNLGGGWSPHNWPVGLVRIAFSYPLGILLSRLIRSGKLPVVRVPFPLVALALAGVILGGGFIDNWAADVFAVLVAFPIVLWAGIGCRMPKMTAAVAGWIGAISYPLYAIHVPLTYLWAAWAPHTPVSKVMAVIGCMALAWGADRFYDRPVRRWLEEASHMRTAVA